MFSYMKFVIDSLMSDREGVVFCGGYDGHYGIWRLVCDCVLWHVLSKNKIGSEVMVSLRIHSVLGCTGSFGNQSQKQIRK